ncbi:putative O-methyltransferase [Gammaproteobacteria bacterium]
MSSVLNPNDAFASLPLEVLLDSYQLSQAIFTLVHLRIPEHLHENGPTSLATLAAQTKADEKILRHLLEIARCLELVGWDSMQGYALTPRGQRLCTTANDTVRPLMTLLERGYAAWGAMPQAFKTGQTPFETVYGTNFFRDLARNPEQNRAFNQLMAITTELWLAATGVHYPFTGHLIDLGGNTGALSIRLLQQFPALRATVFDLPQALEQAPAVIENAGVTARCALVPGSFFEPAAIPRDGDIYLVSRVLLNWNDDQAVEILRNCRQAMSVTSRLLILEFVLPDPAPFGSLLTSLNLWVMFGASIRTQGEFEALLARAGFSDPRWIAIGANPSRDLYLLEARP